MKKIFLFAIFAFLFSDQLSASQPAVWTVNTREAVLKGEARGVSIDETGAVSPAPDLVEMFETGQSYIWSSATDAQGNIYLGTGSDGKIFRVDTAGRGALFADLAELNVAALAVGRSGELFAGTSPDGKVYRIDASGTASVFFDPKEKYIWSLAVLPDGALAIGTGEKGRIYKVKAAGASAESALFFDTSETHIISLAVDRNGNLYAGTDSGGMVLRFSPDGKPFALLDSPLREIHDLEVGPDGSVYALALSETVATAKPTPTPAPTPRPAATPGNARTPRPAPTPSKSRYDLSSARSVVYRILPDGGSDVIWNSPDVTAFSLSAHQTGNGVLIGTSDKGRIYSVTNDGSERLVLQTNENQVSTLFSHNRNFYATTSSHGKLFRFGDERVKEGVYESSVLDASAAASWGRIWWRSEGNVEIQTRSGNTETPDETWSAWSAALTDQKGAQISSPTAKFLQWRAVLKNAAARLSEVNVSYLPRNIAPEILSIEILPTNIGLQPNPPVMIDPNIETSGLDPAEFGIVIPPAAPRRVYQRGARSLIWTAEDRNGDRLEYAVYYREAGEKTFKLLKDKLTENFYTIDGFSLADGRYIFKITATDAAANPPEFALTAERLSEPFEIDNSAPRVVPVGQPQITGDTARVAFEAEDAASYLQKAEYSINGGPWKTVYADDGISDSPRERYTLTVPIPSPGEYSVALRVFDANGNVGNARVLVRK
jgi:hypothetical protein